MIIKLAIENEFPFNFLCKFNFLEPAARTHFCSYVWKMLLALNGGHSVRYSCNPLADWALAKWSANRLKCRTFRKKIKNAFGVIDTACTIDERFERPWQPLKGISIKNIYVPELSYPTTKKICKFKGAN
jgi:hypothetical protein